MEWPFPVSTQPLYTGMSFCRWSVTPVERRAQLMLRIADLIESRLEAFAEAESRDQGKPLWLARTVEIPRAVLNFRSFATSASHHVNMYTATLTLLRDNDYCDFSKRGLWWQLRRRRRNWRWCCLNDKHFDELTTFYCDNYCAFKAPWLLITSQNKNCPQSCHLNIE